MRPHHWPDEASAQLKLLVLQPTPFCNINCDYCYLPHRSSKRQMSLDLVQQIFRRVFDSPFIGAELTVVWHAGEPLVMPISFYRSAFQTIDALNTHQCQITHAIQTNGTLINQAWCELIKAFHIEIGVSLDGPAFIHDAHRKTRSGNVTHAASMRGVSHLHENDIRFHVISVITQKALNFADEMFHFYVDHGIRDVGFNIEEIEGVNQSSSLSHPRADTQYYQFMKRIHDLTMNHPGLLSVREFKDLKNLILSPHTEMLSEQVKPFAMISIDCDGNFTTFSPEFLDLPTEHYGDFVLGNVWRDRLDQISATKKFHTLYQDIQSGVELCRQTCDYFALCGGGAPANKYFENGTLRSAETMYCRYITQIPINILIDTLEEGHVEA